VLNSDTKLYKFWVEFIFEYQLARGGCPKTYIHMLKIVFKPYVTLKIVTISRVTGVTVAVL
jgi:hypothetical protein